MRIPKPKLPNANLASNAMVAAFTSLALLTNPVNMPALAAPPTAVVQQVPALAAPPAQKAPFVIGNELRIPDPRINRGGRIFDGAGILDAGAQQRISSEIGAIEREVAGSQVVVVTVDDVPGSKTPKRVATELFNYWGIGSMERENGVLVLVVKNARRVEIEVGLALERSFDNSWCTGMLTAEVVPSFKEAQYGEGVLKGVVQIGERLRGEGAGFEVANTDDGTGFLELGLYAAVFALASASSYLDERASRKCSQCSCIVPADAIGKWETKVKATNVNSGQRVRSYTCEACGHRGRFTKFMPKYDSVRYDQTTGDAIYYNKPSSSSSSSSDSGGSSSGGGGGGASW